MCPELSKKQEVKSSDSVPNTVSTSVNQVNGGVVLLKTLMVNLVTPFKSMKLRVLLDDGSQKSYIRSEIPIQARCKKIGSHCERNSLFGGVLSDVEHRITYEVPLQGLENKMCRKLNLADKFRIAGNIPKIPHGTWIEELKKKRIRLSDNCLGSEEIDVLIGADLLPQLQTGKSIRLKCGLAAMETIFGWVVMGSTRGTSEMQESSSMLVSTLSVSDASISQLWDLDVLGITDPAESKSKQEKEEEVKLHFLSTVTRKEDGRYSVKLPWVGEVHNIPDNFNVALKRLHSATNKLKRDLKWKEYNDIFQNWEKEGIIESCGDGESKSFHFLPHRPVYKPESITTPVRPVFDASCKTGRNPSLNDCLEKGPNYIELIPSIMLRFRLRKVGVVSDIRKAFQMIEVDQEDSNYLKFIWWENESCEKLKVFRHRRVVFGVSCSPFLLGAVIEHHLENVRENDKLAARQLLKSLYVDNCVTSLDSYQEYEEFKANATRIMQNAKMELRQWEWGTSLLENVPPFPSGLQETTSILGMKWNKGLDFLSCDVCPEMPEKYTKRTLLSTVQKMFDPMGFLTPAIIIPKLILQETWAQQLDWDQELDEETTDKFKKWAEQLKLLEEVRIPRCVTGSGHIQINKTQIHGFSDASQKAYAAVIFIRVETEEGVNVQLLQSKSRVTPLKRMSIPRVELMSCTILARLCNSVTDALELDVPIFYWSDSTTAISWIKRNDEWGTFVGNRVREICQLTDSNSWRHVPGIHNPADLPSRGCNPQELLKSKWWEGPQWLKLNPEHWPSAYMEIDEELVNAEKKKSARAPTVLNQVNATVGSWYIAKRSSYTSSVRLIGWILRFINRARKRSLENMELTTKEFKEAEFTIFKIIQNEVFSKTAGYIGGVQVERQDGLLKVKTKIVNRQDTGLFRYPVLLPHSHPLVERMILEEHLVNGHCGVQFLISKLRERVWIIQTRKAVRKIVLSCVRCRRFKSKAPAVPTSALPENRVKTAKAFQITGVDLGGPLFLKDKTKAWIVLFTCAVIRAVHLELVTSLNTDSFLLALTRFISRRGRPSTIYSDNGTNFKGAVNIFKSMDWTRIQRETRVQRIHWIFNPPTAAWWGGFFERLIQSVKDLLRKMLGNCKLGYVQLETILCHVESVVNGRPLTYVTEDGDDLIPLTPSAFLQEIEATEAPEMEALDGGGLRKKYRDLIRLKEEFRSRFRSEYLGRLVQNAKAKPVREFRVGEIVLVASDNLKRLEWPMAKILELFQGSDGKTRVARVKTSSGELVRPLQRLFPLEVCSDEVPVTAEIFQQAKEKNLAPLDLGEKSEEVVTRAGRKVIKPVRFRYS